jgi:hypothetical protein
MSCCKCCCENKTPPGECCNNSCCESPRVCCGESEPRTCCAEGEICCNGVCQDPEEPCCEGECADSTDCSPGCVCVDGECVTPPPCAPCAHCDFPENKGEFPFTPEPKGQCAVNLFGNFFPNGRNQFWYTAPFPDGVVWKPGGQAAVSGCRWSLATDTEFRSCCCPIPANQGQTLSYAYYHIRHRLMVIECPEGGAPSLVDRTSELIEGLLEYEYGGVPDFPPFCEGESDCYDYLGFFPDGEPVCNPLP